MTDTEIMLLAVYKTVTVPLDRIGADHLNLNGENASRAAALGRLPFPVFRMRDSAKAPWLVHVKDLAAHIDSQRVAASQSWEHSQPKEMP